MLCSEPQPPPYRYYYYYYYYYWYTTMSLDGVDRHILSLEYRYTPYRCCQWHTQDGDLDGRPKQKKRDKTRRETIGGGGGQRFFTHLASSRRHYKISYRYPSNFKYRYDICQPRKRTDRSMCDNRTIAMGNLWSTWVGGGMWTIPTNFTIITALRTELCWKDRYIYIDPRRGFLIDGWYIVRQTPP